MFLNILTSFIAPNVCLLCGRQLADGERLLCLHCLAALPFCHADREEMRLRKLPRTAPVATFDTLLSYDKTNGTATLIRNGKYNDRPEIIEYLAEMLASRLAANGSLADADCLVAVPMHWWKRLRRGYNQASIVAETVGRRLGLPVEPLLKAVRGHRSQTLHSGSERLHNVDNTLAVTDPARVAGRHIVLVDDILTTGATITEAIRALHSSSPSAISIITLAATR